MSGYIKTLINAIDDFSTKSWDFGSRSHVELEKVDCSCMEHFGSAYCKRSLNLSFS